MRRFGEIEGLRAWLSWIVVVWHVLQLSGFYTTVPVLNLAAGAAATAVEIFMIVSGFVVTHLVLERREPYPQYLTRRAFRLFPVYLAVLPFGVIASVLAARVAPSLPWQIDPSYIFDDQIKAAQASVAYAPWLHTLLHLTLLQGVVPDSLLPSSSTVWIGPAWSLSLEWQFYLIAPLVIGGLSQPRWRIATLVVLAAAYAAFAFGLLGTYRLASCFPGAIPLFVTGIFSRVLLDRIGPRMRYPVMFALLGLALTVLGGQFRAIGLWLAFYGFMISRDLELTGANRLLRDLFKGLLDSPAGRWVGGRSYTVYVVHWPIIEILLFALRPLFGPDRFIDFLILAAPALALTFLTAEILHRGVEAPMMKLGSRFVRGGARSARPVAAIASDPSP